MDQWKNRFLHWKNKRENSLNFRRRRRHFEIEKLKHVLRVLLLYALVVLLAFFLVLSFFRTIRNEGPSMEPGIEDQDLLLTNRLIYRIRGPKRDDIIFFYPQGRRNAEVSVKRVIGLPGETVQIQDGVVYIDGKQLTDDVSDETIRLAGLADSKIKLGRDEYFVLGDNRNNSQDSRFSSVGNVSRKDIGGNVWFDLSGGNFGLKE